MTPKEFSNYIEQAYKDRNRCVREAASMLHIEAAELSELFMKWKWYEKPYTIPDLLSEAGDILNFLTYILQQHNLTLEDAMKNNVNKLKGRRWIDEEKEIK